MRAIKRIVTLWPVSAANMLTSIMIGTVLVIGCSCSSDETVDIKREAVAELVRINDSGLNTIDTELNKISDDMYKIAVSQEKLRQVLTPALDWVALKKAELEQLTWGIWDVKVDPNMLSRLQNDRYRITALEMRAKSMGTSFQEIIETIEIIDLGNNATHDWQSLENGLKKDLAVLSDRRDEIHKKRIDVENALTETIAYRQKWEIKKINSTAYYVSGPGLGWSGKQVDGVWILDRHTGTFTPQDEPGKALEQRLKTGL